MIKRCETCDYYDKTEAVSGVCCMTDNYTYDLEEACLMYEPFDGEDENETLV